MTTAAIHQPHYLPYPGLLDKFDRADVMLWLDDAAFSRGGWHNRNAIKSASGRQLLTVPVLHHQRRVPLSLVRINDQVPWQAKHAATIAQAYARAPHLDYCRPLLQALYTPRWTTLGALNEACGRQLAALLGITTPAVRSSALGPTRRTKSARLVELCRRVGADTYLAGDGSAVYLDLQVFAEAGVTVRWQRYQPPVYPQQHPGAGSVPDLSVLDLLANTGPEAMALLRAARAADRSGALV